MKKHWINNNWLKRRQFLTYLGMGITGVGAVVMPHHFDVKQSLTASTSSNNANPIDFNKRLTASFSNKALPDFQGITEWLNSKPLTIADLKGNVILIQFWTFACINCQRTIPYIVRWHNQYKTKGLKVIGVHTPEFAYERELKNIRRAMEQRQISYAVAVDNDYKTWNAYSNQYWPHLFLADRQGLICYDHIGEGAYQETEQMIRKLLG
ncbi:thioredoxin family protein [Gloeothece verrucosa]|uniref:Redoxin domain protein n=1 Tax=Gloeothece verrucosa (strain PCC 7822) TaxID=497965 RepID=E0UIR5_GLOV7|nr:thioredoxin family protein [Gloeothece verrucosa]ADN13374.1 Redoxin domain protein [Gloeothece verrucosa PCC 7822]